MPSTPRSIISSKNICIRMGEATDVRVHERLAPRNRDHRGAAFLDGAQALLHGQLLLEDVGGVLDLAAPGAREVAPEQRLEHEDERVAPTPPELLLEDVRRHRPHL